MLNSILESIFGCAHRKTSFPLTPVRRMWDRSAISTSNHQDTYVVCLDCGKKFSYDWNTMQIYNPMVRIPVTRRAAVDVPLAR